MSRENVGSGAALTPPSSAALTAMSPTSGSSRRITAGSPGSASRDLELDAAVERVACVVGSGADEILLEAHARRFGARPELWRLPGEALFDIGRALHREAIVVRRRPGQAGMSDDVHTHFRR